MSSSSPIDNPPLVSPSPTPYASGHGLFATKTIPAGELVMHIKDPLIAIPDDKHLDSCCAGCMRWKGKDDEKDDKKEGEKEEQYPDPGIEDIEDDEKGEQQIKLVRCSGCTVLWYCGKDCQKDDWKKGHKFECPIYKYLKSQGRVLPVSVRVLVRLLLLRKHTFGTATGKATRTKDWWEKSLRLQGHEKEQSRVKERAEMVPLMSKAGEVYSGSGEGEDVVRGLYCRTLVNSFSITSTPATPQKNEQVIGNLFDPDIALFNHSCEPNCVVQFIGREVSVHSLKEIELGEEATVAYIDVEGVEVNERRKALRETWFFECACNLCLKELTDESSKIDQDIQAEDVDRDWYDNDVDRDWYGHERIVELLD